jgi:hypothetical protein
MHRFFFLQIYPFRSFIDMIFSMDHIPNIKKSILCAVHYRYLSLFDLIICAHMKSKQLFSFLSFFLSWKGENIFVRILSWNWISNTNTENRKFKKTDKEMLLSAYHDSYLWRNRHLYVYTEKSNAFRMKRKTRDYIRN